MVKERISNKNADNYIIWFRFYELTVVKWDIFPADTHNMDESGYVIGISYKSRVIIPVKEKKAIKFMNGKREWATNIDIINSVGTVFKGFFVIRGKNVLRDLISYIIELDCTIAVTDNG